MLVLNQRHGFPVVSLTVVMTLNFGAGVVVTGGNVGTLDDETGNIEELGETVELLGMTVELAGIGVEVDGMIIEVGVMDELIFLQVSCSKYKKIHWMQCFNH